MPHLRRLVPALLTIVAAVAPTSAGAAVTARTALLNGTGWSEFDQTNASTGTLSLDTSRSYEGGQAAKATFNGGANGYERGIYNVSWPEGSDVWYSAAFYLPTGFKSQMQGQVDLMRWDNYGALGTNDHRSGVVIHRNGMGNLMRMKFGVENVDIGPAFTIPEGRWFWLEVHQKLSRYDGTAYSEVFIDGTRVSTTTTANMYGTAVDRVRYGLVAIDANAQTNPLTLWFDRAMVSTSQVGPLGATVSPAPAPADTTPPDTTITSAPSGSTTSTSASVSFTASESGSTFECSLDGAPFAACTSPHAVSGLAAGDHTVAVRAKDAAGNVDATPATATWTVSSTSTGGTTLVEKAHGGTASASSVQKSSYPAGYAIDASTTSRWSSKALDGQWWQVDLGRTRSVQEVQVVWEAAYARQYAIDVSSDGANWTQAAAASASGAGTVRTTFAARSARYVRVRCIARGTSYGISTYDVRVLGASD